MGHPRRTWSSVRTGGAGAAATPAHRYLKKAPAPHRCIGKEFTKQVVPSEISDRFQTNSVVTQTSPRAQTPRAPLPQRVARDPHLKLLFIDLLPHRIGSRLSFALNVSVSTAVRPGWRPECGVGGRVQLVRQRGCMALRSLTLLVPVQNPCKYCARSEPWWSLHFRAVDDGAGVGQYGLRSSEQVRSFRPPSSTPLSAVSDTQLL